MSDGRRWTKAIRAGFDTDLAVVALAVAGTVATTTYPVVRATPVRAPFAFALVVFLPGYALVAAAFPERYDPDGESARPIAGGVGPLERVVLSVAVSIATVILTGVVLVFSPVGFVFSAVLFSLSGVTLGATVLAAWRRGRLRPHERYSSALDSLDGGVPGLPVDSPLDAALSVLLVVSTLSVGGVIVADAVTPAGTPSTDLFVLAPNESGQPTASDYPTTLARGESQTMVVGVTNRGEMPANYTVVTVLQRIDAENDTVSTTEQVELDEFGLQIEANRTVRQYRAIVPTMTGSRLRLAFLLYRGQPPAQPTVENADREVHLFVNVTGNNNGQQIDSARSAVTSGRGIGSTQRQRIPWPTIAVPSNKQNVL